MTILRLQCKIQTYKWGKVGDDSIVAQLAKDSGGDDFQVNPQQTYAELWMGTHPSGPSLLYGTDILLSDYLRQHPSLLYGSMDMSQVVIDPRYVNDIPFLFKVLSVNTALSIQAHPDLQLAKKLHASKPQSYKDGNHKPEMAIALPMKNATVFEGLCGFKTLEEISISLQHYQKEVAEVFGNGVVEEFIAYVSDIETIRRRSKDCSNSQADKDALKKLFEGLMVSPGDKVKQAIAAVIAKEQPGKKGSLSELFTRLNKEYPGDVGVLAPLMLNYVQLHPNTQSKHDALFLAPNEPHAYLSGNIVECMAASDNVVRAGLTPKERDVDTLVDMLTYQSQSAHEVPLSGIPVVDEIHPKGMDGTSQQIDDPHPACSWLYRVPVDEFMIVKTLLGKQTDMHTKFTGVEGPSIMVVISGEGSLKSGSGDFALAPGYVYFVGAECPYELSTQSDLLVFRASAVMADFDK